MANNEPPDVSFGLFSQNVRCSADVHLLDVWITQVIDAGGSADLQAQVSFGIHRRPAGSADLNYRRLGG